ETRPPTQTTLCPYTTLFRSHGVDGDKGVGEDARDVREHARPVLDLHAQVIRSHDLVHRQDLEAGHAVGLESEMRHAVLGVGGVQDRKSTRLNSSHEWISYAV